MIDVGEAAARVIFAREAVELRELAIAVAVLRDLEADLLANDACTPLRPVRAAVQVRRTA